MTPQTVGKWNAIEISRQGEHVTVVLNGEKVIDIMTALHPGGHIALQAPAEGIAKFRNLRIKTLSFGKRSAAVAARALRLAGCGNLCAARRVPQAWWRPS